VGARETRENLKNYNSGIYFIKLEAGDSYKIIPISIIK